MKNVFYEAEFYEQEVVCAACGWKGKGSDAVIIDLYGLTQNVEVHCPECDAYLGALKRDKHPGGESADPISIQFG